MPNRVEVYDVTCPASTAATAPIERTLFDGGGFIVRKVSIIIPDGHSGLTGIALAIGHQPILPRNALAYISGNDEMIPFDLDGYPPGVSMSAFLCNVDLQSHSWELRFEFDDLMPAVVAPSPVPIPPVAIYSAGLAGVEG